MKSVLDSAILIVLAVFAILTSFASIAAPDKFAKPLGFLLSGPDGHNEVRAQYGGFFFSVALASVLAIAGKMPRQVGLIVNSVLFGGLILGRLASLAIDGGAAGYGHAIRALYLIDATGFVLSLLALLMNRSSTQTSERSA